MASMLDKRRLGTESGRLRRAARRVERSGGNPTNLLEAAEVQKLKEGSAISSAEENSAAELYDRRINQGVATAAARSLLDRRQPATTGGDSQGAFRNGQGSSMGWKNTGGSTAPAAAAAPTPAPVGPSLIDGKPAAERLAEVRQEGQIKRLDDARNSPSSVFGSDIAKKNLETKGLEGAAEDYKRRASTPAVDPATEPGNMAELRERDKNRLQFSPLQSAFMAAKAQRISANDAPAPTSPVAPAVPDGRLEAVKAADNLFLPDDQFSSTPAARAAGRADSQSTPSSLGGALQRDLSSLKQTGGNLGRSVVSGLDAAGRAVAAGAGKVSDALANETIDTATRGSRIGAALVPGETGKVLRSELDKRRRSAQESLRKPFRNVRLPSTLP